MKIGIAAPIYIHPLSKYLANISQTDLPPGMGGTAINSLVEGLIETGNMVSVYTLDESVLEPIKLVSDRFSLYIGNYGTSAKVRSLTFFKNEAGQITDFIREDQPDIVNAHWSYEFGRAVLNSNIPYLISLRDHSWTVFKLQLDYYRFFRYLMDVCVRMGGEHFSVNSPYLQTQFSPWRKNLPILPNSISTRYIKQHPKRLRANRLKIISALTGWSRLKNPFAALKAFSIVREKLSRKISYHMYGPGYQENGPGHAWARENSLDRGVEFKGIVPHSRLMELIPSYDLLLHPSLEESFGNTLIEGMANGVPIIGGRGCGAVPWVLNQGKNGILTDVSSPRSIALSILCLLRNEKQYAHLSCTGIEYVLKKFSSLSVAKQYIRLYENILAQTDYK